MGRSPSKASLGNKDQIKIEYKEKNKYPDIAVGDKVRLYMKKDKMDKERTGVWTTDLHEVEAIKESEGQNLYKIKNCNHWFLRADILLVNDSQQQNVLSSV